MTAGFWRALGWIGKGLYWLFLVAVLAIFPVLQSWEALPEGGIWAAAKIGVLGLVALAVLATRRALYWHIAVVLALLVAGVLLFCVNQGLIRESPTESDVRILQRTSQLLAAPDSWDRSASRTCAEGATRLTLYCALRRASFEEVGSFRHRRPALQIIRSQIGKLRPNANYEHRLSGFNSDPSVTVKELQALLASSISEASSKPR